ncbi:hypothetical protein GCM10010182_80150 [Actinomadura cremea]|nr:hypothetical protein GCM10010182_80150 [Actinomadura cremea]
MTGQSTTAQFNVPVDHRLFLLVDNGQRARIFSFPNKLIAVTQGYAAIRTGIAMGNVRLKVEVRDQEPASMDLANWEEVVEISFDATVGQVRVESVDDATPAPAFPVLTPHGPGHYRIRVHARGRHIAFDKAVSEPVEDYLLQIWPAAPTPQLICKQIS